MNDLLEQTLVVLREDFADLKLVEQLRSGKEATVFLVSANGQDYALKVYRPYASKTQRKAYMSTEHLSGRVQRALKQRTEKGKQFQDSMWVSQEYRLMKDLVAEGAAVPLVLASTNDAVLMEFIGAEGVPAPRLSEVRLNLAQARYALRALLDTVQLILDLGFVHGDLSAFNVLWHDERIYVIDFPQAVDTEHNRNAPQMLDRDLLRVEEYFEKVLGEEARVAIQQFRYRVLG